jgi:Flp pilus assembly protein TadG
MRRRLHRRCSRRGAVAVEAALVLGICLITLLGLLDFGRVIMTRLLLDNAVREGARLAIVSTNTLTTQDIQNAVTDRLAGQTLQSVNIAVYKADATGANIGNWTDAGLGECIAVEISGNYLPTFPKISWLPATMPMRAKCVRYSEAN